MLLLQGVGEMGERNPGRGEFLGGRHHSASTKGLRFSMGCPIVGLPAVVSRYQPGPPVPGGFMGNVAG